MRCALGIVLLLAMSFISLSARAEDSTEARHTVILGNIDGRFGAGAGSIGIALHAGIGAQAWLGDLVGVGAEGGFIEDDAIFGDKSHATYVGPTLSIRTSGAGSYLFATAGAGIASRTVHPGSFCIFDPCSGSSKPDRSDDGMDLELSAGAALHFGAFELAPFVRAESIVGARMITLNIAVGGVVAEGSE